MAPPSKPLIARVRTALELRRFGLAVLAHPESAPAPPAADADAWHLFLAVERCAMPLLCALGPASPDVLRDAAARESASVLAATAQARALGAAAAGFRLVVLKGGAELLESGPSITLGDLDVLVTEADLQSARELVDSLGYEPRGHGTAFRHDPPYHMPGGIPMELHTSIEKYGAPAESDLFDRAVPLAEAQGLYRLSPTDHAWQVLLHATDDHLHRRGRIRDLLLLVRALRRMTEESSRALESRVESHAYADAISNHLRMAESLRCSRVPQDHFAAEAAALYMTYGWLSRSKRVSSVLLPTAADAPAALLAAGPEFRDLWLGIGQIPDGMSPYAGVAGVERAVPAVGRIVRIVGRVLRAGLATSAAVLVTPVARRLSAGR